MATSRPQRMWCLAGAVVLGLAWPAIAAARGAADDEAARRALADPQSFVQPAPAAFDGIGLEEHRGDTVPLDLTFRDDSGAEVALSEYFTDGLPVILTFNYSTCPQLCSVQLNALTTALAASAFAPGWHYHLVTVILNPRESVAQVADTKAKYLAHLPEKLREHAARGWHFLLGDDATIHRLAAAVGFQYKFVPEAGEYAHPAVITFLTSRGIVNRYIHGLDYEPTSYDQSIAFAGTDTPQESAGFLHRCFVWDPDANNYSGMAMSMMRYAAIGCVTLLLAGFGIWQLVRRHRTGTDPHKVILP